MSRRTRPSSAPSTRRKLTQRACLTRLNGYRTRDLFAAHARRIGTTRQVVVSEVRTDVYQPPPVHLPVEDKAALLHDKDEAVEAVRGAQSRRGSSRPASRSTLRGAAVKTRQTGAPGRPWTAGGPVVVRSASSLTSMEVKAARGSGQVAPLAQVAPDMYAVWHANREREAAAGRLKAETSQLVRQWSEERARFDSQLQRQQESQLYAQERRRLVVRATSAGLHRRDEEQPGQPTSKRPMTAARQRQAWAHKMDTLTVDEPLHRPSSAPGRPKDAQPGAGDGEAETWVLDDGLADMDLEQIDALNELGLNVDPAAPWQEPEKHLDSPRTAGRKKFTSAGSERVTPLSIIRMHARSYRKPQDPVSFSPMRPASRRGGQRPASAAIVRSTPSVMTNGHHIVEQRLGVRAASASLHRRPATRGSVRLSELTRDRLPRPWSALDVDPAKAGKSGGKKKKKKKKGGKSKRGKSKKKGGKKKKKR